METGWPPPELLVTVSMTSGMRSRPTRCDQGFERGDVHVAFEWMHGGWAGGLRDDQIDGFGAGELDVGAGGVEVRVVGDDVAFLAGHAEQDALGGAALVGGNDVLVAENVLDGTRGSGRSCGCRRSSRRLP